MGVCVLSLFKRQNRVQRYIFFGKSVLNGGEIGDIFSLFVRSWVFEIPIALIFSPVTPFVRNRLFDITVFWASWRL